MRAVLGLALTLGSGTYSASVPSTTDFFYAETFESGFHWVKSDHSDYHAQPVEVSVDDTLKPPLLGDQSLILKEPAKKYGVAGKFSSPLQIQAGQTLVVQYEVKLTLGLTCGGAYLKLLRSEGVELEKFDGQSPYTIMFGPDSCGDTNKVHLIIQHQNPVTKMWEEKHLSERIFPEKDTASHLYTLVIRAEDNSYEVFIDTQSKAKGSLLSDDFSPPINPPAEIDDPSDVKPEDWVDEKRVKDLEATKPDDWDEDAPRKIPDPSSTKPEGWLDDEPADVPDPHATMPDDWDEDEDGDWEAPLAPNPKCASGPGCGVWKQATMDNPAYKGKWYPPMIDNPLYKGEWVPAQIPNPDFYEDKHPAAGLAPMGSVAVEVWTMSGGIRFDNVIIGFDEAAAKRFAEDTFLPKQTMEKSIRKVLSKEEKLREREEKRAAGGINNLIEVHLGDAMDFAAAKPYPVLGTLLVLMATLVYLCSGGDKRAAEDADALTDEAALGIAARAELREKAMAGPAAAAEEAAAEEAAEEVQAEDDEKNIEGSATKKKKSPKA